MKPILFYTHETSKVCYESGTDNRLPETKLKTPGTKGLRRPETTWDCVNLGLLTAGNKNRFGS